MFHKGNTQIIPRQKLEMFLQEGIKKPCLKGLRAMCESIIIASKLSRNYSSPVRRESIIGGIQDLFKRQYRTVTALKSASFEIARGELIGLIGPNGAGKSTTIKLLTGILTPTEGTVEVMGYCPHKNRQRLSRNVGTMFGQRTQLWWDLTPMDGYQMLQRIYEVPEATFKKNVKTYSDILGLDPFINRPIRKLSLGERVRSDLTASLIHDPTILFLDEPTIGLDVLVKEKVRTLLRHLSSEKKVTILLTTHDINDIAAISDRILILSQGQIVFDGTFNVLRNRMGDKQTLVCTIAEIPTQSEILPNWPVQVEANSGTREIRITYDGQKLQAFELIKAIANNYTIENLTITPAPVDELIRGFYEIGQSSTNAVTIAGGL